MTINLLNLIQTVDIVGVLFHTGTYAAAPGNTLLPPAVPAAAVAVSSAPPKQFLALKFKKSQGLRKCTI